MRHRVKSQRLSRNMGARRAVLRDLAKALLIHQRIKTRPALAKEVRKVVEKLITLGKRNTLSARRRANRVLNDRKLVKLLFDEIAPKFSERNGGYTRIYKLAQWRKGDGASLCIIELTEFYREPEQISVEAPKEEEKGMFSGLRSLFKRQRKQGKDREESQG